MYHEANNMLPSLVHMRYLESLMNMNSRSTCLRCEGNGFVHLVKKAHSKPTSERCKLCSHCLLCDGSGVLIKIVGCSNCKGNGFVHHFRHESEKHNLPFRIRCGQCVDCYKCRGKGAFDPEAIAQSLNLESDVSTNKNLHKISNDLVLNTQSQACINTCSLDNIHPHLRGVLERLEKEIGTRKLEKRMLKYSIGNTNRKPTKIMDSPLDLANELTFSTSFKDHSVESITPVSPKSMSPVTDKGPKFIQFRDIMNSTSINEQSAENQDAKDFVKVVKADANDVKSKIQRHCCPKCKGKGWNHTGSAKHSKRKNTKCKFCTDCLGCNGTGLVSDKISCIKCETRGFFHPTSEREHDLPANLRCFYCRPCTDCEGSGLVDSRIVKPLQLLKIKF